MKSSENSFETQKECLSYSIRLGTHFPQTVKKNFPESEPVEKYSFEKSQCRKNGRKDPSDFMKIQFIAKYRKIAWGPFRNIEKFSKELKNESYEQCRSAQKFKRGDPSGFINTHSVAKLKGIQKLSKKISWCRSKFK